MIDLETLDTSPTALVLTIGAVKFNPYEIQSRDDVDSLYLKIDVESCDPLDLSISDDTLEWWAKQKPEAIEDAFSNTNRTHIKDAMDELYKFCWGCKAVWSNGAGFDIVILENIFRKLQKKTPWDYWNVRDVRTILNLGFTPQRLSKAEYTAHNALDDAYAQTVSVQSIFCQLKELRLEKM